MEGNEEEKEIIQRDKEDSEKEIIERDEYDPKVSKDDPLDDNDVRDGLPLRAYTINEMRICDEKMNIVMPGHWSCPIDPTCISCFGSSINRFNELKSVLESMKSDYLHLFKDRFGEGLIERREIVLMAVNYGQLYLFLNWICSLMRIGIDPKEFTVVIPTDKESYKIIKQLGVVVVDYSWVNKLSNPIGIEYNGVVSDGHADINNVLLLVGNDLMQAFQHNIILHDVDIVWMKDIRNYLRISSIRRHILGQVQLMYI